MINKRGQGMSTSTIVLLILAVVVLVILILGFTMGWGKIAPWLSKNNVDDIVTSCETACVMGGTYDFCSAPRTIMDGQKNKNVTTCIVLSKVNDFKSYGIKNCPAMDCSLECDKISINGQFGSTTSSNLDYNVKDVTSLGTDCYVPIK